MKTKLITAALTAVTLALSVAPQVKAQYASRTEANYIFAVADGLRALGYYDAAYDVTTNATSQTHFLRMGYGSCLAMERGETPEETYRYALADGASQVSANRALVWSAAAALTLCPEHSWMVQTNNTEDQTSTYYSPERTYRQSTCTLRPDTNIRSGPSTTSSVIANESTLLSDAIEIHSSEIGRDGASWSWIGFQGGNGRTAGWVKSEFIQPCS